MSDTYPTLHQVNQLLDSIAERHGVLDQLTGDAAERAVAEGEPLMTEGFDRVRGDDD